MLAKFITYIIGLRKWSIMAGILGISVALLVTGYITGSDFVDLHKVCVPAFMGTNVAEHLIKSSAEWLKTKLTTGETK